jgi:hypothetical protein
MAIRNYWIDANIDGRKTRLTGGPRRKDGGFDLRIKIRNDGGISDGMLVVCGNAPSEDGTLKLVAYCTDAPADEIVLTGRR